MQSQTFGFSAARKNLLAELLSTAKPRLQSERIRFFISEVEREIAVVLRYFPEGWPQDEGAAQLDAVRKAASSLREAFMGLDEPRRVALFGKWLFDPDSGYDVREVSDAARDIESSLIALQDATLFFRAASRPVDRFAEDIAYIFAKSYVIAFGCIPSIRHDSAYKLFVDDITENDLPERFRVSIGKHKMDLANKQAKCFLDERMRLNDSLNKTVPEICSKSEKPSPV
ncbi:hypothetical protein [Azonexus sp.]|uniref:hypothetical protein n=1 Tax=Azonexus sp. TaxID=1872668 RepID=UPI0035B3D4FD